MCVQAATTFALNSSFISWETICASRGYDEVGEETWCAKPKMTNDLDSVCVRGIELMLCGRTPQHLVASVTSSLLWHHQQPAEKSIHDTYYCYLCLVGHFRLLLPPYHYMFKTRQTLPSFLLAVEAEPAEFSHARYSGTQYSVKTGKVCQHC